MCLANPLTDQIGRRFFTDKFPLNNVCYVVNLQLVHSFPPNLHGGFFPFMGGVIPPGLVAEDGVIPAKANAAMGTWFPFLLKGIEPFPLWRRAGGATRSRAADTSFQ